MVLTVDLHDGSNRETLFRAQRVDKRQCAMCHGGGYSPVAGGKPGSSSSKGCFADYIARKPMFDGLDVSRVTELLPLAVSWELVKLLRATVPLKFLIKGIVTG